MDAEYRALEVQRQEVLRLVADWPERRLEYRPGPGEWSAVEVLDHIVRGEVEILSAARRGVEQPHRIGIRDRLGFRFIEAVFRSPRRVKVPASAAAVLPDASARLPEVVARWNQARAQLAAFLEGLEPPQLRAGVFRHPVSGWMTVPQMLRFFAVHIEHHRFQLDRLRDASAEKPAISPL